jgi:dTDP-4-amino-4,6-dideoxy-D-galactose acyltransferase
MFNQMELPHADALVNTWERVHWDSEFLGYEVSRLQAMALHADELRRVMASARKAGQRLMYVVAAPDDALSNASARQVGAWLADRKVTFCTVVPLETAGEPLSRFVRSATQLTTALESLALQSGEFSRFRLDPRFEPTVYARLYRQWLRNSLNHRLAQEVLIVEFPKAPIQGPAQELGLLTLGVKHQRAAIGLLAVDEPSRGQGIGQQLVKAAKQRTAAWGLQELQVVTQLDNARACTFYRRCGFQEAAVEHVYHLWL